MKNKSDKPMDPVDEETAAAQRGFEKWLRDNPNNFSFWYPKVKDCGIPTPRSVIVPVPLDVVESLFLEREGDSQRITAFVKDSVLPAIPRDMSRIFVKNGCFSNKFDFRWCTPGRGLHEMAASFHRINYESLCLDTGGNAEFVIRELVGARDNDFPYRIYNGMTLRPEVRVFYDFDNQKVLYSADYWDRNYCEESICRDATDAVIYRTAYPAVEAFVKDHASEAEHLVEEHLRNVRDIPGTWSVDLMWAQDRWWLIDMAVACQSAYWNPRKAGLE